MNYFPALAAAILIAFASYRVWALIALDDLTRPLRLKLFSGGRHPRLRLFWMCPWCAGFWVTLGITLLSDLTVNGGVPSPVLVAVAAAAGTALLGGNDERLMTAESEVE